jgi:thioredoxin 1
MLVAMSHSSPGPLHVACLCAAWCRTCEGYAPVFQQTLAALRTEHPDLRAHWIDIEDQAELVGNFDVETFPTLVVVDAERVRFAGPLTPQPETLMRLLRMALGDAAAGGPQPAEVSAFAERLRGL